jgi:predicted SPOUT superfamily RNA methylase MTH1
MIKVVKQAYPELTRIHIRTIAENIGKNLALRLYKYKDSYGYISLV